MVKVYKAPTTRVFGQTFLCVGFGSFYSGFLQRVDAKLQRSYKRGKKCGSKRFQIVQQNLIFIRPTPKRRTVVISLMIFQIQALIWFRPMINESLVIRLILTDI